MKRKILFGLSVIFSIVTLNAEYPSIHRGNLLGEYATYLNEINSGANLSFNYTFYVSKSASKGDANAQFYTPTGWNNFKIYIPSGVEFISLDMTPTKNASLRYMVKFQGLYDSVIDHASVIKKNDATWEIEEKTILFTGTPTASIGIDTSAVNQSNGGWLYVDAVEDNLNLTSYFPNQVTNPTVRVTLQLRFSQPIDDWIDQVTFINGDPSDEFSQMTILSYPSVGVTSTTTIGPVAGTQTYNSISQYTGTAVSSTASTSSATTTYTSSSVSGTTSSNGNTCPTGTYMNSSGDCIQYSTTSTSSVSTSTQTSGCSMVPNPFSDMGTCSSSTAVSSVSTGGNTCPTGTTMVNGECVQSTTTSSVSTGGNTCPTGTTMVDGECVQTTTVSSSSNSSSSNSSAGLVIDNATVEYVLENYQSYGLYKEEDLVAAIDACREDPVSCDIVTYDVLTASDIANLSSGEWHQLPIFTETYLSVFEDTVMILVSTDGVWKGYAPEKSVRDEIVEAGYEILDFVPAKSVVWIFR